MAKKDQAESIGAALAAYFTQQGLTQVQVAECYGISQSWVGRIYRGCFSARAESVKQMCRDASVPFLLEAPLGIAGNATRFRLTQLLDSVWEGTEEDAICLIDALRAIKKLRQGALNTKKTANAQRPN